MTDRELKRKLKDDSKRRLPPMSAELREEAERLCPRKEKSSLPRLTGQGLAAVCLAAVLLICTAVISSVTYIPADRQAGIVLEINPCVVFSTGRDDIVTAVVSRNREGDILLSDRDFAESLIGIPAAQAVVRTTDMAVRMGFIRADERENAVKVSAAGSNARGRKKLLSGLGTSLEDYFLESGIFAAVLTDDMELREYRERLGLAGEASWEETADGIAVLPEQQLELAYRETSQNLSEVYLQYQLPYLREQLDYYCGVISDKRSRLLEIYELNERIEAHADNPGLIFGLWKDYWSVRYLEEAEFTPEFSALIAQMDMLVGNYTLDYPPDEDNLQLDSKGDLIVLKGLFSPFDDATLAELRADVEQLGESPLLTFFLDCLDTINRAAAELIHLVLQVPDDAETCLLRTTDMIAAEADTRREQYGDLYERERNPLTREAYDDYLAQLDAAYGSLENFWESRI